ncbi:unnamed protein product, partial [Prorocentrum cordatum]
VRGGLGQGDAFRQGKLREGQGRQGEVCPRAGGSRGPGGPPRRLRRHPGGDRARRPPCRLQPGLRGEGLRLHVGRGPLRGAAHHRRREGAHGAVLRRLQPGGLAAPGPSGQGPPRDRPAARAQDRALHGHRPLGPAAAARGRAGALDGGPRRWLAHRGVLHQQRELGEGRRGDAAARPRRLHSDLRWRLRGEQEARPRDLPFGLAGAGPGAHEVRGAGGHQHRCAGGEGCWHERDRHQELLLQGRRLFRRRHRRRQCSGGRLRAEGELAAAAGHVRLSRAPRSFPGPRGVPEASGNPAGGAPSNEEEGD